MQFEFRRANKMNLNKFTLLYRTVQTAVRDSKTVISGLITTEVTT